MAVQIETLRSFLALGMKIFPLFGIGTDGACECGKPDCPSPGKHPRISWKRRATAAERSVKQLLFKWPNSNWAATTGGKSQIVVLDIDSSQGESELRGFLVRHGLGELDTLTVRTGKGRHLYFRSLPGTRISSRAGVLPGVDVRSDGGYVVLPGSKHQSLRFYEFAEPRSGVMDLPEPLTELLIRGGADASPQPGPPAIYDANNDEIRIGERNDTLFREAARLRGQGMEREEILPALQNINETRCEAPLENVEVMQIVDSVINRYEPGNDSANDSGNGRLPWWPFYAAEWLSDIEVVLLKDYQRAWLINLRAHAWKLGGRLPADLASLRKLAGASMPQKKFDSEIQAVLALFKRDGDYYIDTKLEALHREQKAKHDLRVRAGQISAEKKRNRGDTPVGAGEGEAA